MYNFCIFHLQLGERQTPFQQKRLQIIIHLTGLQRRYILDMFGTFRQPQQYMV